MNLQGKLNMCSSCNGDYHKFMGNNKERFKYLEHDQIVILMLHDLIEAVRGLQTA